MIHYVSRTFGDMYSLSVVHDLPKKLGEDKPPQIGGFRPDLYARDAPVTTVIIGEAKTSQDIETEHTKKQFTAYLTHLTTVANGIFIIAVTWTSVAVARRVLAGIACNENVKENSVKVVILDELKECVILWP